jgi:hypothetical protein
LWKPLGRDLLRNVHDGERGREHTDPGTVRPRQAVQVRTETWSLFFEVLLQYLLTGPIHDVRRLA